MDPTCPNNIYLQPLDAPIGARGGRVIYAIVKITIVGSKIIITILKVGQSNAMLGTMAERYTNGETIAIMSQLKTYDLLR